MNRGNKIGLVVASSFLALVGVVVAVKIRPATDQAEVPPVPVAAMSVPPPRVEQGELPPSSSALSDQKNPTKKPEAPQPSSLPALATVPKSPKAGTAEPDAKPMPGPEAPKVPGTLPDMPPAPPGLGDGGLPPPPSPVTTPPPATTPPTPPATEAPAPPSLTPPMPTPPLPGVPGEIQSVQNTEPMVAPPTAPMPPPLPGGLPGEGPAAPPGAGLPAPPPAGPLSLPGVTPEPGKDKGAPEVKKENPPKENPPKEKPKTPTEDAKSGPLNSSGVPLPPPGPPEPEELPNTPLDQSKPPMTPKAPEAPKAPDVPKAPEVTPPPVALPPIAPGKPPEEKKIPETTKLPEIITPMGPRTTSNRPIQQATFIRTGGSEAQRVDSEVKPVVFIEPPSAPTPPVPVPLPMDRTPPPGTPTPPPLTGMSTEPPPVAPPPVAPPPVAPPPVAPPPVAPPPVAPPTIVPGSSPMPVTPPPTPPSPPAVPGALPGLSPPLAGTEKPVAIAIAESSGGTSKTAKVATPPIVIGASDGLPKVNQQPPVRSFSVFETRAVEGDTWDRLSYRHYGDVRVAAALKEFTRNYPMVDPRLRQDGVVRPGDRIFIPNLKLLMERYSSYIRSDSPKPPSPGGTTGPLG